jgi:hypothetical protein
VWWHALGARLVPAHWLSAPGSEVGSCRTRFIHAHHVQRLQPRRQLGQPEHPPSQGVGSADPRRPAQTSRLLGAEGLRMLQSRQRHLTPGRIRALRCARRMSRQE